MKKKTKYLLDFNDKKKTLGIDLYMFMQYMFTISCKKQITIEEAFYYLAEFIYRELKPQLVLLPDYIVTDEGGEN